MAAGHMPFDYVQWPNDVFQDRQNLRFSVAAVNAANPRSVDNISKQVMVFWPESHSRY